MILPVTLVNGMIFNTEIRWRLPLIDSLLLVYAACMITWLLDRNRTSAPAARSKASRAKPAVSKA
jgi:lipopolysaccharide export system protein LptC